MNFVVRHEHENLVNPIANVRNTAVDKANQVLMPAQVALQKIIGKRKNVPATMMVKIHSMVHIQHNGNLRLFGFHACKRRDPARC